MGGGGVLSNIMGIINNQATFIDKREKDPEGKKMAQLHFLNRHKWRVRIYVSSSAENDSSDEFQRKKAKPFHVIDMQFYPSSISEMTPFAMCRK